VVPAEYLIIEPKTTGESEVARLLRVKTVRCQSDHVSRSDGYLTGEQAGDG
jgi:hypothetical protein